MTRHEKEQIILNSIDQDALRQYFLADFNETLGIYSDGHIAVGQDVGKEIDDDEAPIAVVKCPGTSNLDYIDFFCAGWTEYQNFNEDRGEDVWKVKEDGRLLTLKECIEESCQFGDMTEKVEDLKRSLIDDLD